MCERERERIRESENEEDSVCVHRGHSHNFCTLIYVIVTTKKLVTTISHNLANSESGTFNSYLKIISPIVVTKCELGEYH